MMYPYPITSFFQSKEINYNKYTKKDIYINIYIQRKNKNSTKKNTTQKTAHPSGQTAQNKQSLKLKHHEKKYHKITIIPQHSQT